ncbi:hypothetical protein KOR34_07800 [Posidoniimonas corsicana]|uniref:Uncharacterized protein n=1 Tax=Posidoniimonas corsicana TaxID=1938618 RepID=A0A5C5VD20_9BACT|nr:hypothetical protein [Posidoniimonas corsicana]TWT35883.1 hypothetical protein KOR34_07800 [Posidoniimonas corsicana]
MDNENRVEDSGYVLIRHVPHDIREAFDDICKGQRTSAAEELIAYMTAKVEEAASSDSGKAILLSVW